MIANGTQNDHSVAARGGRSGCFSIEWRVKNSPGAGRRLLEAAGQTGIECGTVAGSVDARGRKGSTALAGRGWALMIPGARRQRAAWVGIVGGSCRRVLPAKPARGGRS